MKYIKEAPKGTFCVQTHVKHLYTFIVTWQFVLLLIIVKQDLKKRGQVVL